MREIALRLSQPHFFLERETTEPLKALQRALASGAPSSKPLLSERFAVTRVADDLPVVDVHGIGPVKLLGGPAEIGAIGRQSRVFRYDLGYRGHVVPVFVHIDRATMEADRRALTPALRLLVDTRGNAAVLYELSEQRIPKRIFIDGSGTVRVQPRKVV